MSSSVFRWYKVTSNVKNTPFSVPKVLSEPCTIYKRKVDSRIRVRPPTDLLYINVLAMLNSANFFQVTENPTF